MTHSTQSRSFLPQPLQEMRHALPPSAWLMALELRSFLELGSLLPAKPLLGRAPKGDGHPVIVFPGLTTNDMSTHLLRKYLVSLGHSVAGWDQGFNLGPRPGVLDVAKLKIIETFERTGRKLSLVGWSLGGIYARELAKDLPHMVRCVITMGTPFSGAHTATNAWKLYELASGQRVRDEMLKHDLPTPPMVPTTSIYSRTDGIVAWQGSVQAPSNNPNTENIEVIASHLGLGVNPSAWWAIADRLSQPEGQWQPFWKADRGIIKGLIFPDTERSY